MLRVLADTGAQVSLVNRGLFDAEMFVPARRPVDLRSVSGDRVGGGDQVIYPEICFQVNDCGSDKQWEHWLQG